MIVEAHIFFYVLSFILIWYGAGLIVSSLDTFARKLRLSAFAVSFVLLGLLTSTPEFAVGLTSIAHKNPEIFVGNLLGGIPVIFLLIIPLLAVIGNGVALRHYVSNRNLLLMLGVIVAPSLLVLDMRVTNAEALILIFLYIMLLVVLEKHHGLLDRDHTELLNVKAYSISDIFRLFVGGAILFIASQIVVDQTMFFSNLLSMSPLYISLIVLSLGTNLPELSLAARSVVSGKKEVAIGDYLGSAAANTLLFGIFTLMNTGDVFTANRFPITFVFIAGGLAMFYIFSRSKNTISRKEGFALLLVYALFVFFELKK